MVTFRRDGRKHKIRRTKENILELLRKRQRQENDKDREKWGQNIFACAMKSDRTFSCSDQQLL